MSRGDLDSGGQMRRSFGGATFLRFAAGKHFYHRTSSNISQISTQLYLRSTYVNV
jgi:hypothetical protein